MRGTICIVESDHVIRLSLVRSFEEANFPVVDFESADRALLHLRRRATGVIMILTSVDLPGIFGGLELVRVAHLSWPGLTTVIARETGSVVSNVPAATIIVSKPVVHDEVLACAHLAEQRDILWRKMNSGLGARSSYAGDIPSSIRSM